MSFPEKSPHEEKLATFDFAPECATVGTVLTNPAVTASHLSGTGVAADLVIGTPSVNGQTVIVMLSEGIDGAKYRVSCEVDADNGEHHQIDKDLPVKTKGALVE